MVTASTKSFEFGIDTFGDVTLDRSGAPVVAGRRCCATSSTRLSLRSRSASIVSEWVSIIGATLPSPLPRSCLRRSPAGHPASGSALRSPCSAPTIRCASSSDFRRSMRSHGRAEVILGRGSFTESYPLFGYDMAHYEQLFEEKLEVFAALLKGGPVTWKGSTRSGADGIRSSIRRSRRERCAPGWASAAAPNR